LAQDLVGAPTGKESSAMSIFPTKILLATDGSEEAELARTTAMDMATSTDSELHVVTVAPGYPSYDVRVPEIVEQLRKQAEKILDEQVEKIERDGGKVAQKHLRIAERHRAQQIVRVAEEIGAGLIVMGSRGLGGVRRALMGSVSDSVVRHAHCPVLVVRHEKERAA
jgi:nucleotide-binding universal stress UspA family protein